MRSARALVFPSRWFEVVGMVVEEAHAMGLPTIVSDVSAATEMVSDGREGLHFRSGSAVDLAEKMGMLLDDAVANQMGEVAFQRFWANPPTLARHARETRKVYDQVWSERAKK